MQGTSVARAANCLKSSYGLCCIHFKESYTLMAMVHVLGHASCPHCSCALGFRNDCFVVMLRYLNELSFYYICANTAEGAEVCA